MECFEKSKRRQSLLPLQSLKNFRILYSGSRRGTVRGGTGSPGRPFSTSPQRSRSLSPARPSTSTLKDILSIEGRTPSPKSTLINQSKTPEPVTARITPRATSVMSPPPAKTDPVKSVSFLSIPKPEVLPVRNPEQARLKLFRTANSQGVEHPGTSGSTERPLIPRPIPNPTSQNKLAMLAAAIPPKNSVSRTGAASEIKKKITPVPIKMTQIKLQTQNVSLPCLTSPRDEKEISEN